MSLTLRCITCLKPHRLLACSQGTAQVSHITLRTIFSHGCRTNANVFKGGSYRLSPPINTIVISQKRCASKMRMLNRDNWIRFRGVLIFVAGCCGLYAFDLYKRAKVARMDARLYGTVGEIDIGAPWKLTGVGGKPIGSADFKGEFYLLYFGFTHCPDICPDELEKITKVMNDIGANRSLPNIKTVFVTVDPERDTLEMMRKYCEEFHPDLLPATGSHYEIAEVCKDFRVYYSRGPEDNEDGDYVVDHTIMFYLVDPEGKVKHYYGQTKTRDEIVKDITERMAGKKIESRPWNRAKKSLKDTINLWAS